MHTGILFNNSFEYLYIFNIIGHVTENFLAALSKMLLIPAEPELPLMLFLALLWDTNLLSFLFLPLRSVFLLVSVLLRCMVLLLLLLECLVP